MHFLQFFSSLFRKSVPTMSSSSTSSTSSLTTCCICLERMKEPIKTLPCLHSSCSSCIDELVGAGQKPFQCPLCRTPFGNPSYKSPNLSLLPDTFTSQFLASSSSLLGKSQSEFDPNNVKCEGCEENQASEYCKECTQFYCKDCKRIHLRAKMTSFHQFLSVDDGLKRKEEGSSTRCELHPQYGVNFYCPQCFEACCPECVIDHHVGHQVVRLATISQQLKDDLFTSTNKVKQYTDGLSQTIKEIAANLAGLKDQAMGAEERVQQFFAELRSLLDEREAELLGEIETERHQKEKELTLQKDDLEFFLKGIYDSVSFSERLLKEGSEEQIVSNHRRVSARLETLENEMKKGATLLVTNKLIEFVGKDEAPAMIQGIGRIKVRGIISPEKSCIFERGNLPGSALINRPFSLGVSIVDRKGNQVTEISLASTAFQINVSGPSKDVKVKVVEVPEKATPPSISFVLDHVGEHEISIMFKGKHLQGSPFRLKVVDPHVYRRDYGSVDDQTVGAFGSGAAGGQFSSPSAVGCNSRDEIIVADTNNHRIQVFDRDGNFLFKFGSFGNGDGKFNHPYGVIVDRRNDQIVVADTDNHRIQIFDETGKFLRSFGSFGNGEGKFNRPAGVVVDQTNGTYLVTEFDGHRMQIFDSYSQFVRQFGTKGDGNGKVTNPWGIGLLSSGNIVVCDYGTKRIQIFDPVGKFVRIIAGKYGLSNPCHLFIDSNDNILVADRGHHRIQVFTPNGDHVKTIKNDTMVNPAGICMDSQGRIIIADQVHQRISIF